MKYVDKLTDMAKTVAGKTAETAGSAVEMGRVSLQRASENGAISCLLEDLGSLFYDRFEAGMEMEGEALELCQELRKSYETLAELEARKGLLKKQLLGPVEGIKRGARAAAQKAAEVVDDLTDRDEDDGEGLICPHCGAPLRGSDDFCPKCGRKADGE